MDFIKHHKLIIIVAAVVLVVAVWWGLSSSGPSTPILSETTSSASAPLSAGDQDLVATLLTLRAVKLDGTIFSDPAFISLRDFSTEIVPEPVGRPNPFAPLGVRMASSTSATSATKPSAGATKPR